MFVEFIVAQIGYVTFEIAFSLNNTVGSVEPSLAIDSSESISALRGLMEVVQVQMQSKKTQRRRRG